MELTLKFIITEILLIINFVKNLSLFMLNFYKRGLRLNMDLIEKTLASEVVYEGKIITVYKDEVELSTGKTSFREVVEHSGGVVILAICKKDGIEKVLMVKQFRYPLKNALLELPAGKLEKNEDPFEAAKRELTEETGYTAKNWQDLGCIFTSPGYSDEKLYLYKATDLEFVGECPDEGEILIEYEYTPDEIKNMIKNGEITDAKTICAVMRGLE